MRTTIFKTLVGILLAITCPRAGAVDHFVSPSGGNISPFTDWAAAATNIQDAIDAAAPGDVVWVTNGVYATGGKVMSGDLTNRVALDKALTVQSVNGPFVTIIQGAWDPATNGPLAVRCAWLTNGAVLEGFTLRGGATRAFSGTITTGAAVESGAGAWCSSSNAIVSNCLLTNNAAIYGGGIAYGTLDNSLVVNNTAGIYGGGAYYATLNNCTVLNNAIPGPPSPHYGAGTYDCVVRNSIVLDNFTDVFYTDNYHYDSFYHSTTYSYSCTAPLNPPLPSGSGNIDGNSLNPQLLDSFHIAATSPCRGAGSALYASGTDLDGEPWANPPSMGCDEIVESNLVGPLVVGIQASQTNGLVNERLYFSGLITGRATRLEWTFGDGTTVTNMGASAWHSWTNTGDYSVVVTAYNTDHPEGVSTNLLIYILPLGQPVLEEAVMTTNGFQLQFTGQAGANYYVQTTTNLASPASWQTIQTFYYSTGGMYQVTDPPATDSARFYRVQPWSWW